MEKKIHLQGMYGERPAKEVQELKVGDIIVWNFGFKSEVVGIDKETKTQKIMILKSLDDNLEGKTHLRRMGKSRLVAVA